MRRRVGCSRKWGSASAFIGPTILRGPTALGVMQFDPKPRIPRPDLSPSTYALQVFERRPTPVAASDRRTSIAGPAVGRASRAAMSSARAGSAARTQRCGQGRWVARVSSHPAGLELDGTVPRPAPNGGRPTRNPARQSACHTTRAPRLRHGSTSRGHRPRGCSRPGPFHDADEPWTEGPPCGEAQEGNGRRFP